MTFWWESIEHEQITNWDKTELKLNHHVLLETQSVKIYKTDSKRINKSRSLTIRIKTDQE